ncbi:MAG TPA: hypothetical protein VJZ71_03760 [Phycisphaerae bacterium]|nr:hypothetical protein [Phycisphaerae bacterium]
MTGNRCRLWAVLLAIGVAASFAAGPTWADPQGNNGSARKSKKSPSKSTKKKTSAKPEKIHVRWGKRRSETDAQYDKRYARLLKKTVFDKEGDKSGGETRLWTYMGHPFIVRTDISKEFTADTAMYMEMLHREYGEAFSKLLGVPAQAKEKIEVVVYKDQATYTKSGGSAGSGGQFMPGVGAGFEDRGEKWPARRFRLMQFTSGVDDFARWPKAVLKHEAAHMEMQLRLGMNVIPQIKLTIPVDCPRWWNEGMASVFEYWDFDKTVDENFALIPDRGRYAPVIRRIHGTDRWKDFNYVWTIDGATWGGDMTKDQGFLNYAQAWSLAAYMMHEGKIGRKDFRAIFNLSKRVGADSKGKDGEGGLRAWEVAFSANDRDKLEKNWNSWVATNVPRTRKVPDEDWMLMRSGFNPDVLDKLIGLSEEDLAKMGEKIAKEQTRRKKNPPIEK